MSYTKGKIKPGKNACLWIGKSAIAMIFFCLDEESPFKVCDKEAEANAERLALCWNTHDKLLDALKITKENLPFYGKCCKRREETDAVIEATIAEAEVRK